MILYTTICFFAVFFAYIAGLQDGRWNKIIYVSFFLIWILLGFQNDCGIDIENYRAYFVKWSENYTPHLNGWRLSDTRTEYGWYLLNKFFSYLGGFRLFLVTVTLFMVVTLAGLVRKNVMPQYYWFSIAVFVFCTYYLLFFASGIRQATCIAINIIVFNLLFGTIKETYKWPLIIILSAISFSFHQSSIVALPVYILVYFFNRPVNYKLLISVSLILYVVIALLPIEQIIDQINLLVAESGIQKYEKKIVGLSVYSLAHNGFYFVILFLVLDTLRYYDLKNEKVGTDEVQIGATPYGSLIIDKAFKAMFLLVAFSILGEQIFRFGGAAHRIMHYFDIFGIVVYPIMIQRYKEENIWMPTLVASLLLFRFITSFGGFFTDYQGINYMNFMISFN